MRANELRIGNLVKLEGISRPIKVSIIDTTETSTNTKYKPIPLTEEWLLRFGFLKDVTGIYRFWKFECYDYLKEEGFVTMYFGSDEDNPIEIAYVHTLQNLYFALTGEELNLKE